MALPPQNPEPLFGIAFCAGVGGLELGLHIAEPGYRTVCYVEREAFAAATLVARMEDEALDPAPLWDDVTTFDGSPWRGKVHLLTAGYPCQPFSFAGHRKGEDDPRHLWPHIRRIIAEVRPEWCFFENVEGHMSLGADAVFKDLRRLGFTVKAGLFSALETGASHHRRRLFIVAHADQGDVRGQDRICPDEQHTENSRRPEPEGIPDLNRNSVETLDADMDVACCLRGDADKTFQLPLFPPAPSHFERWADILARHPTLQPQLFGLDDGMADWVDRSEAGGNGVVSLAAAYAWKTLRAAFDG